MERQLFEWKNWDQLDVAALQFYDCTLKVDIGGGYKKGDSVKSIVVDFNEGFLAIYDDEGKEVYKAKLKMSLEPT